MERTVSRRFYNANMVTVASSLLCMLCNLLCICILCAELVDFANLILSAMRPLVPISSIGGVISPQEYRH